MRAPTDVHIQVLGPARVTIDGRPAPAELLWRKHLALLVYLARSPRRARTREHLVALLWSERDEKAARHSLSEALRVLRRVLGDERVRADVDQVSLDTETLRFDCDELAARCAAQDWAGAAPLVQGEFLEGLAVPDANEFETWLAAERLTWRTRGVDALTRRAEARFAEGDIDDARAGALQALRLEPTAEAAARVAIRALALTGDRAGALEIAEHLVERLRDGLEATPATETRRLVERVRESRVGRRVPAAPPGARPRAPLVGRRDALARLTGAWARSRAEAGELVVIEGEPGEGKTRLLDELLDRARLEDATVAASRVVSADEGSAWSGLAGLLSGGLSDAPGLAATAPAALATLRALAPDLIGPTTATPPLEPARAFAAAVRAMADEQPVLLALDDAHYVDAQTGTALPQLARDLAARSVLMVLCVATGGRRPEWLDMIRSHIGRDLRGDVVRLERLDSTALDTLTRWWLPRYRDEEAARLVRRLERDTAGLPLLATAMLEAVASGFRLSPDAPAWPGERRTLVDTLPGDLPPAVIGAVCLRFRQLPEGAREVLGAAAALGERLTPRQLEAATGLAARDVERALDALEWDRWLAAETRGYAFAAPIVRAVLLHEMLTPGQARRYRDAVTA